MGLPPQQPLAGWFHTHDISYRRLTFPVWEVTYGELVIYFSAGGVVEWMRAKSGGPLLFRGSAAPNAIIKVKGAREIPMLAEAVEQIFHPRGLPAAEVVDA